MPDGASGATSEERARSWRLVGRLLVLLILGGAGLFLFEPMLLRWSTYGFHDWDVSTAFRHVTTVSLLEYGEPPWWHPWLCGGFPAFGYAEGATNFVSPYLPLYLLADVRVALRLEVLGATLTGLLGAYLLAGRFTRSRALRAFVAVIAILNGRFALQAATGHTWHLQYCWLPWVLLFFDRAEQSGRLREAVYAGACLALMVYLGGVYPLPHTALLLLVYAPLLALFRRSWRPLPVLLVSGLTAIGFSAPKLLAVLDGLARHPRLIESDEAIGLRSLLVMMTERAQLYGLPPIAVPDYGWHEWGLYIGWAGLVCLMLGLLLARGPRERALQAVAGLLLLLGLGAFHPASPWALLHQLPPFSSQHVPSRFHFTMLLPAALLFASWADGLVARTGRGRPWLEPALLLLVGVYALDLVQVGRLSLGKAFLMEAPARIERASLFEHRRTPSVSYRVPDWSTPVLPSMLANRGVIDCYGIAPIVADRDSVPAGARGADEPGYPGRAYLAGGPGRAEVVEWSPNRAVVRYEGATPGALLVYNMNFDPGWRAGGAPALDHEHAVAARLEDASGTVEFRYVPRTLGYSLWLPALTLAGCLLGGRLLRRGNGAAQRAPAGASAGVAAESSPRSTSLARKRESRSA